MEMLEFKLSYDFSYHISSLVCLELINRLIGLKNLLAAGIKMQYVLGYTAARIHLKKL